MNKVLLAAGLLSAGVAFGQQTTGTSSTSTSTSSYNNYNTGNYNSQDATSGRNSSTDKPSSVTTNSNRNGMPANGKRRNNMNSTPSSNSSSNGTSYNNDMNNMGTSTAGSTSGTPVVDGSTVGTGTGTYNSTTTGTTTGSYNNSVGTSTAGSTSGYNSGATTTGSTYDNTTTGTSATTPATNGTYNNSLNSANGTSVTTTDVYSTQSQTRRDPDPAGRNGYNNFVFGVYGGLNATNLRGESVSSENPSSRLGYQLGLFFRGGGRLYGQVGAEYFASSSNYFRAGNASSPNAVRDYINIQYIQVPVYIGYKISDSERGNSAIRVQVGAEYANRINSNSRSFNLSGSEIKTGSFNALGQVGFDFGPFLIDLTYHHGLSDAVQLTGFQGSARRILSASVGFKF